ERLQLEAGTDAQHRPAGAADGVAEAGQCLRLLVRPGRRRAAEHDRVGSAEPFRLDLLVMGLGDLQSGGGCQSCSQACVVARALFGQRAAPLGEDELDSHRRAISSRYATITSSSPNRRWYASESSSTRLICARLSSKIGVNG